MAERLKAVDSKSTRGPKSPLVGSNPTLSAMRNERESGWNIGFPFFEKRSVLLRDASCVRENWTTCGTGVLFSKA